MADAGEKSSYLKEKSGKEQENITVYRKLIPAEVK